MIGRKLQACGRITTGLTQPVADALNEQRTGVMIRVTTLIGMRDDRSRAAQLFLEGDEQLREMLDRVPILYRERAPPNGRRLGRLEGPVELLGARLRVRGPAAESGTTGVSGIPRCTVGHVDEAEPRDVGELAAEAERLIVRMRCDQRDRARCRGGGRLPGSREEFPHRHKPPRRIPRRPRRPAPATR
jgi:hypothetical protein